MNLKSKFGEFETPRDRNSEVEVGSLTPFGNVNREEKYQRELTAITNLMAGRKNGKKAIKLWKELETKETVEASFAFLLGK